MDTLRSILVHLDGTDRAEVRLRLAHRLAALHDSALTALFAVSPAVLAVLPMIGGLPPMPMAGDIDPDHRAHAAAVFERLLLDHASRSDWRELRGEPVVERFVQHALTSDLMVLGQRDPREQGRLRRAGRFHRGGAAQEVHLVAPMSAADSEHATTMSRLCDYLRLHGVVQTREHEAAAQDRHAGEALLSLARDTRADLLVMGAYGHSPARKLVSGGATLTVLERAPVPVRMAH